MKKLILLAICAFFIFTAQAQNDNFKINTAFSLNYTLTGSALNSAIEISEVTTTGFQKRGFPSIQATVDYSLNNWFSVGLAGTYQSIGYDFENNTFTDENGQSITEDYTVDFSRITVALRPLFHYGNIDNIDMYSGLRIQYFKRNFETTSADPETESNFSDFASSDKIGVGIVVYGVRYYLTENIGLGAELNLGRPYLINFSVNARF